MTTINCTHPDARWELVGCNDDGWHCNTCKAHIGFSPHHDRELVTEKVGTVLLFLHEHEFIYVSNATMGDSMTASVAKRCVESNIYDQQSIARFILEIKADERHQHFWQLEAAKALDQPTMTCPRCGVEIVDFDGFGVLAHVAPMLLACGYCTHPSGERPNGADHMVCGICNAVVPDEVQHG